MKWKIHRNLFDVYRTLRAANPSPISITLNIKDYQIAGASPEMLVNVTKGIVSTKPIAGTIGRSILEEEDKKLEQQLPQRPQRACRTYHAGLIWDATMLAKFQNSAPWKSQRFMHVERYSKSCIWSAM